MADESHDDLLLIGRLAYADSKIVCAELEKYGQRLRADRLDGPIESFEKALFSRQDPSINFALARFGGNTDVLRSLYLLSGTDSEDESKAVYLRALKVACLSNCSREGIFSKFPERVVGPEEEERLIRFGSSEETYALFTNPSISTDLLKQLFRGEELFADIDEEQRRLLIRFAGRNSRLHENRDSEHGPDMGHWDIHKAIVEMFASAPASVHWFRTLEGFQNDVNPFFLSSPDSAEQVRNIIDKWRDFTSDEESLLNTESVYTGLTYLDDFRCDIASRFGFYANDETGYSSIPIGSFESEDLVERCAYYGVADMSVKMMEKAYAKDEMMFTLAALQNQNMYGSADKRMFIEEHCLRGYLTYTYKRRCVAYKQKWKGFDPEPVSEWMREDDDDEPMGVEAADEKPRWATEIEDSMIELAKRLAILGQALESVKTYTILILIAFVALAIKFFW